MSIKRKVKPAPTSTPSERELQRESMRRAREAEERATEAVREAEYGMADPPIPGRRGRVAEAAAAAERAVHQAEQIVEQTVERAARIAERAVEKTEEDIARVIDAAQREATRAVMAATDAVADTQ